MCNTYQMTFNNFEDLFNWLLINTDMFIKENSTIKDEDYIVLAPYSYAFNINYFQFFDNHIIDNELRASLLLELYENPVAITIYKLNTTFYRSSGGTTIIKLYNNLFRLDTILHKDDIISYEAVRYYHPTYRYIWFKNEK